ncbi:hypothetical protein ABPG75_012505 [Micractinium tetrahymenae]
MAASWQRGGAPPFAPPHQPGFPGAYPQQHQQQQPYYAAAPAVAQQQTSPPAQPYAPAPPAGVAAASDSRLRSVDELPPPFRAAFPFRFFNAIQNECWPAIYQQGSNVVVAAPTGGGKTVLLELAILRLLSRHLAPGGTQFAHQPGHLKAVYLAPSRALVQEKVRDWSQRFAPLGVTCRELTGDTDQEGLEGLDTADIICATPEKFDATTRSGMRFFADIGLMLIDEVHLLNESRGASLEGGVARIKMISRLREMQAQAIGSVRFVAVSATIPNVQDLAEWLGVPPAGIKCFGEEMRPVKLRCVVRGYNPTKSDFLFERRLNDHIFQVIADHSSGKPTLVFCSSRRGTTEAAASLAKTAGGAAAATGGAAARGGRGWRSPSAYVRDAAQLQRLQQAAAGLRDKDLGKCVEQGVGYHHAALEPSDRAAMEALFTAQDLPVLCTTSTLAMGVNLPARLVVLKGTRRYVGSEAEDSSGYQEYERSTCLQMVGRAGRPQYDTEGVAVIMTQKQHVRRYEQLMNGSERVESTLKEVFPEFLNAEITLRTIGDVSQAVEWLRCTYFYVRVKRDPAVYGVPRQPSAQALDRWLKDRLVLATVAELAQHGMVRLQEDGFGLEPLQPGQVMAERYVRMKTMVSLCQAPQGAAMPDLISILAGSAELSNIKLRRSEKKVINEINHSAGARYPLMNPAKPGKVLERVATGQDKIFVLINEGLSDTPSDKLDYSMKQDIEQAVGVGRRLASAMVKYFEHQGRAAETFNALLLAKSLTKRLWTDSRLETRQLAGIGPQIAQRLADAGVSKLRQLAAVEPRRLESLAQRHFPFGNEVHAALAQCLPPPITLQCLPVAWLPGGLVELEVTVERTSEGQASSPARLLVGSLHDDALLLCRSLALEQFPSPLVLRCRTRTPVKGRAQPIELVASVVHERLVGMDTAIRTVVPPGVELQGQRCQAAQPKQAPAGSARGTAAQPGSAPPAEAVPEDSAEDGAAAAASPAAARPELDAPPGGMPGALQLMQRRLGSTGGAPRAAAAPAPVPAPPQQASRQTPAAAAAGSAASPQTSMAAVPARVQLALPPPPAAAAKGKWRSFVQAPQAAPEPAQQQQQPPPQEKPRPQGQQDIRASLSQWQQRQPQRAGMFGRPPSAGITVPAAGPGLSGSALRPGNSVPAPSFQPGGLFSRFALGSGSAAEVPAAAPAAQQAAVAAVHQPHHEQWQQQQESAPLFGIRAAAASFPSAARPDQENEPDGETANKRRKLSSLLPPSTLLGSALPLVPLVPQAAEPARAPQASVAAAPPPRKPVLPKLAWLSGRFGSAAATPDPAVLAAPADSANEPAVPLPAAAPPPPPPAAPQQIPPAEVGGLGTGMFDFFL